MSVNIGGNIISTSGYTPNSEIIDPNIVTDGLVLWIDPGNLYSSQGSSSYYNCGYGCQFYASDPGCTNCNTQVMDMSGNGNDLTLYNGASILYSDSGGNLSFDGSNDNLRIATSAFNRTTGDAMSIGLWINPGRLGGQYQEIVCNRSDTLYNWMLYQHITDGSIQLHGTAQNKSSYIPPINTWTHIMITITTGGLYNLYVDGSIVQTVVGYTYNLATPSLLCMGVFGTSLNEPYLGLMGPTYIYNRAITQDEVIQNFNADRPRYYAIIAPTPSNTPSITPTISITPTPSITRTPSISITPSPTHSPPVTPTPSPACTRPGGLTNYTFWSGHNSVNFTGSQSTACAALLLWGSGGYNGQVNQVASLTVGQNVYELLGTSCTLIVSGYYLANLDASSDVPIVVEVTNGVITSLPNCPSQTPTPTPTISITPTLTPTLTPTPTISITPTPSAMLTVNLFASTDGSMGGGDVGVGYNLVDSPYYTERGFPISSDPSSPTSQFSINVTPGTTVYFEMFRTGTFNDIQFSASTTIGPNTSYIYCGKSTPYSLLITSNITVYLIAEVISADLVDCPIPSPTPTPTITPTPSQVSDPYLTGLEACWNLEEASGTLYDSSYNNHDLTDTSGVSAYQQAGKVGYSINFTGDSAKAKGGTDSGLNLTTYTISAWIKLTTGYVGSNNRVIYSKFAEISGTQYGVSFEVIEPNDTFRPGQLLLWNGNSGKFGNTNVVDNNWHHVLVTYDGSAQEANFYVDGSNDGFGGSFSPPSFAYSPSVVLGNNDFYTTRSLEGNLDAVAVWNRVLTAGEISYVFNGGSGRSCAPPAPTPSVTPTLSITPTPSPSVPSAVPMTIANNTSTFGVMSITDITVNGVSLTPSPGFPYDSGQFTFVDSPYGQGYFDIVVTLSGNNSQSNCISVRDSTGFTICQNVDVPGDWYFLSTYMSTSLSVNVVLNDGTC